MTAISFGNVVKRYGATEALAGLSLDVRDGEMFGLIGPDGAGGIRPTEMAQIAITSIVGQMLAKKAFQSITDMWRARQIREMGERIDAELAALKGGK